jgi:hypothetical protein
MKSILELNDTKVPAVKIEAALNKYDNVMLFPEKLRLANEMLKETNFTKVIAKNKQLK